MRFQTRTLLSLVLTSLAGTATAQSTLPDWSTYCGGTTYDEGVVVKRGPGNLVTIVGHTDSSGLATGSAFQQTPGGKADVFIARFDPSQPPAGQRLWCTYLGGAELDLVFDAEVDPVTGTTTVVGLSQSSNFPAATSQPIPILRGPSDGFVAQISNDGSALLLSTFVGGSNHDRLCEVELSANGNLVTIAGVTESTDLHLVLPTTGTLSPTYRGGTTDAFVARLIPSAPPTFLWATHLGGGAAEGIPFTNWAGWVVAWAGNLDRMGMTLDRNGDPVVATTSFASTVPALTTSGAFKTVHAGGNDAYVAILDGTATTLRYGTFFGGATDDRVKCVARHPDPAGGFVLGGLTGSTNLPVSAGCYQNTYQGGVSDGYLAWIVPNKQGPLDLAYATYFGGVDEDNVTAVECESSGVITFGGYSVHGSTPVTPRCLESVGAAGQTFGFVARLDPAGGNASHLLYASLLGPLAPASVTMVNSLVLDPLGDVFLAGATGNPLYYVVNAWQPTRQGGRDAYITHLPLLPGPSTGVARRRLTLATPCGSEPLYTGMGLAPIPGTTFSLTATNAPPSAPGVLALGFPHPTPQQLFNGWLLIQSPVLVGSSSNPHGFARLDLPVPASLPTPPSLAWGLGAQWVFLTNPACTGSGVIANSDRLEF